MLMTNPAAIEYGGKVSKEELRRQKDIDAARKAGTAPAAKDADGNSINPHIPGYIAKAPWYADMGEENSLAHQRKKETVVPGHVKLEQWYDRGAKAGPAAKKFRKGACENCGAMTHKKQDCVERPRKRGAKFSGKDIVADEVVQKFDGDYDAKRDRWNGYDSSTYRTVVDEYEAQEEARRKYREEEIDAQNAEEVKEVKKVEKVKNDGDDSDFGSSDEEEEDEDKYAEAADQVGQSLDTKNRITVRNLRLREDTAKYLINLNPESAYYDPKTRSMRDAPEAGISLEDQKFAGDNFTRFSGDATNMAKLQTFAYHSTQRGNNVHPTANPTAGELLHREFLEKKEVMKDTSKVSILAKYGGEQYLERMPKELLSGQTEQYVEYSRTGELLKGQEKPKVRSKYQEDVYLNNHKSVWGSWFDRESGQWGFACCHSLISGSYCTGKAGLLANSASSATALLASAPDHARIQAEAEAERAAAVAQAQESERSEQRREAVGWSKSKAKEGEDIELDRDRLKKALEEEKKRKKMGEDEAWQSTKKSKTDVTQEEIEAYRLSKQAYDDPMANYKDTVDE